jgi:hypothetical protein
MCNRFMPIASVRFALSGNFASSQVAHRHSQRNIAPTFGGFQFCLRPTDKLWTGYILRSVLEAFELQKAALMFLGQPIPPGFDIDMVPG